MLMTRHLLVTVGLASILLLPLSAGATHTPLVLSDVTGGEAEGKGTLVQGWLMLKLTRLPPQTEILIEGVESSYAAPRRLGQTMTRENGRARLRIDLKDTPLASGATIHVRPVTEGIPRDVVLEGKIP